MSKFIPDELSPEQRRKTLEEERAEIREEIKRAEEGPDDSSMSEIELEVYIDGLNDRFDEINKELDLLNY